MSEEKNKKQCHRQLTILAKLAKTLTVLILPLLLLFNARNCLALPPPLIEFPSSWNPVGSGARALGMGGAFIAVADDATAASWNPGGLIQLETPEISIVGASFSRKEDTYFLEHPEGSEQQTISYSDLNYLSLAYPFSLFDHNMIFALSYQNLYDFDREWKFTLESIGTFSSIKRNVDFLHDGSLSAIGFSYSTSLTSTLSMGITLNFWQDWLGNHGWEQTTNESGMISIGSRNVSYLVSKTEQFSFSGFNANLGFLWRFTSKFTIGGVVKTPFTADLNVATSENFLLESQDPSFPLSSKEYTYTKKHADLDMPLSYGIGFSYRFNDAFSISADIYRTEWQDFLMTESGEETSPITGLSKEESDIDPTTQVRLGCEYLFIGPQYVIPLRGGIFYDPAPAPHSPDDFYGISLGTGIAWKNYIFDIAYQYRSGNDVGEYLDQDYAFSMDSEEHRLYTSLIIHF